MKKFSKNSKHSCLYSNKTIYLIQNENYLKLNLEEEIKYVELDSEMISNIFIITENKLSLANIKKQNFNIFKTYQITRIHTLYYVKILYLKGNPHYIILINNFLYYIDELKEIKNIKFESCVKESYLISDKANGECILILDESLNFYVIDCKTKQLKSKIILFETHTKQNQVDNLNFMYTNEGLVLFWTRKHNIESALIKSIEGLKNVKMNKGNNNYLNTLNEIGVKNMEKTFSFYSKDLSILLFSSSFKLIIMTYWSKTKRFNFCEVENEREILDVDFSIFKKKNLSLYVLTKNNIISVYDIEMKNSATKFNAKIRKDIKIDTDRNQIIKLNLIKNSLKVNSLSEIKPKPSANETSTLNSKLDCYDVQAENHLDLLTSEDKEKLKEEALLIINDLIKDNCNDNLNANMETLFEDKIEKLFDNIELKFKENIINFSNEMEKTIYEENLLSSKLDNLTEYYQNLSIEN